MNFVVNSNPQIVETISQARTAYAKSEKGRQQFEEQGKAMSEFFKTEEGQQEIERRAQKHREFNQTEEGKKGMLMYDVNGKKGPNVWGKDVFGYDIYEKGFEPFLSLSVFGAKRYKK